MSSQTKIIKDIMSTYNSILENKNVLEATDIYDNVDFKDYAVGKSAPSKDTINTALLQDVQTAAKSAGLKVDITTAVSGHDKGTRHETGNAVDVAIINGKAVSSSNRADADKLVAALVSMGYVKNSESGNPKAVLTFGFGGHDNHVHISNNTTSTSQAPKNTDTQTTSGTKSDTKSGESTTTTNTGGSTSGEFARQIGKSLLNAIGINESKFYSSFGKNHSLRGGEIILPKESNSTVKSPVDGVIAHTSHRGNCDDPLTIKLRLDDETLLLSYCGLESTGLRIGDKVNKGDVLGKSGTDVRVTLTTLKGNRQYIDTNKETGKEKTSKSYFDDKNPDDRYYDDSTNEYSKLLRKGYHNLKKNLFKYEPKNKVQENIDRIKGLLK
jgi:murein DD-endopeptidase MepM/ murein hydrolase activator NlpD